MNQKALDYFFSIQENDIINISPFLLFHYLFLFEKEKNNAFGGLLFSFFPKPKHELYFFVRQRIIIERKILYAIKSKLSEQNQKAVSSFGISLKDASLAISVFNTFNKHIEEEYTLVRDSDNPKEPELSLLLSKLSELFKVHKKEQNDESVLKQLDLTGVEIKKNKKRLKDYVLKSSRFSSHVKTGLKLAFVSLCLVLCFYKPDFADYKPQLPNKTSNRYLVASSGPKVFVVGNSHMVGLKNYLKEKNSKFLNYFVLEDSYKNTTDSMKQKKSDVRDFSCYCGRNLRDMLLESNRILSEMNKLGCKTVIVYEGTNSLVAFEDLSEIDNYAKLFVSLFHENGKKVFFAKMPDSLSNAPLGPNFKKIHKLRLSKARINHYNQITIKNSGCDGIIGTSKVNWKINGVDPIHGMTWSTYRQWCNSFLPVRKM